MTLTRRDFVAVGSAALAAGVAGCVSPTTGARARRHYHACFTADALERDPDLIPTILPAGIKTVWLAGFFYGHWPYPVEKLVAARRRLEQAGIDAHIVNVPLGHPGDSLGSSDGSFPLTPPRHWRVGHRLDATTFAGTSLHPPATEENVQALRQLQAAGFRRFFLDDDFRLARGPGEIGGCFCADHQTRFRQRTGYSEAQWRELLEDVRQRRVSPLLRAWIEFTCDELGASFQAQQQVVGRGRLGPMVMYLGAEKAGLRLRDYQGVPVRVGELMFDDASFGAVKGKTDELFSVLFHRRYVEPVLAYSETTAYPADRLSAAHLAAKLVISTISDVRHTMFMSGVTPFPRSHWGTLGPAMRTQARLHERLAGHRPHGPFKHFWGEASRLVGDDRPNSLFLATGVPFEVTDGLAGGGWTFLSDADAAALPGSGPTDGTQWICRPTAKMVPGRATPVEETLVALFAFKARVRSQLVDVPIVDEDEPVVCAWYPTARAALLWNLTPQPKRVTLLRSGIRRAVELESLGARVVEGL